MTPNYSPFTPARDGFLAPRFVHWLVKVVTGAAFTALGYGIGYLAGHRLAWALAVALVSFFGTKAFRIQWIGGVRSTWAWSGAPTLKPDLVFDFTLNLIPWLILASVGWPVWILAGVGLALYPFASP
jgi:hypothetical protein